MALSWTTRRPCTASMHALHEHILTASSSVLPKIQHLLRTARERQRAFARYPSGRCASPCRPCFGLVDALLVVAWRQDAIGVFIVVGMWTKLLVQFVMLSFLTGALLLTGTATVSADLADTEPLEGACAVHLRRCSASARARSSATLPAPGRASTAVARTQQCSPSVPHFVSVYSCSPMRGGGCPRTHCQVEVPRTRARLNPSGLPLPLMLTHRQFVNSQLEVGMRVAVLGS